MQMLQLYDYYRSSSAYRVRIALNLKNLPYEKIPVNLVNQGGEQHFPGYREKNPQELVPSLALSQGILTQSLAIMEYLEEIKPDPPFLPDDPFERAKVRSLALLIACDLQPLNNLRVLHYLRDNYKASEEDIQSWYHHWLKPGFDAFEALLKTLPRKPGFCFKDSPGLADIFLIPQVYNAKRFQFSMKNYPLIAEIEETCLKLPAFYEASP